MNRLKKTLRAYRTPLLLACLQWFLTTVFQVDRAFFSYDRESLYLVTAKGLFLAALAALWCFGFRVVRRLREGDSDVRRGLRVFTACFAVLMALLLILWPGTWSWDDLLTLDGIQRYDSFFPWQHILTGMYMDVLLQFLPFPGGVILLQNAIIALCVAYSLTRLERAFGIRRLRHGAADLLLKLLPFLLPPVLLYQFSGYRIGMYIYLEFLLLVILVCDRKEEKRQTWPHALAVGLLTATVASWRTESAVYLPFILLLVILVRKDLMTVLKKIACAATAVLVFGGLYLWQNAEQGNGNYLLMSLIRPCVELVRAADPEADAEELAAIDRVTDVEVILSNPRRHGEALYWDGSCVRNSNADPGDDSTPEDFSAYVKAFLRLALKYPRVVLTERLNLFIESSGLNGRSAVNIVEGTAYMFEEGNKNQAVIATQNRGWIANWPVFRTARTGLVHLMGGMRLNGTRIDPLRRLMHNAAIPILLLIYAWVRQIIRRNGTFALLCTAVLLRVPVVILTQPSNYLMYLLPFYFLGYVYLAFRIWIHFSPGTDAHASGGRKEALKAT